MCIPYGAYIPAHMAPIWDLLYTHVVWDTILFTLVRTEFFQYPDAFKKWDGDIYIFKEDSQQHHQAYVLSWLFLCYNDTCGLILAPTLSVVWLYFFIFFILFFLNKVSCWHMYASCVFECVCDFIWQTVNITFEWDSGVEDICFPLTSTTFFFFFFFFFFFSL